MHSKNAPCKANEIRQRTDGGSVHQALSDFACSFMFQFLCEVDWKRVYTYILQVLLRSYLFIYPIMTLYVYVLTKYVLTNGRISECLRSAKRGELNYNKC